MWKVCGSSTLRSCPCCRRRIHSRRRSQLPKRAPTLFGDVARKRLPAREARSADRCRPIWVAVLLPIVSRQSLAHRTPAAVSHGVPVDAYHQHYKARSRQLIIKQVHEYQPVDLGNLTCSFVRRLKLKLSCCYSDLPHSLSTAPAFAGGCMGTWGHLHAPNR